MKKIIICCYSLLLSLSAAAQPVFLTDSVPANELAAEILGEGVTIFNAAITDSCPGYAYGSFFINGAASDIGIESGIVLTSGALFDQAPLFGYVPQLGVLHPADSVASTGGYSAGFHIVGDEDVDDLLLNPPVSMHPAGLPFVRHDHCTLEFDMVPMGDSIQFKYVFASDEYPEYACTDYIDIFCAFISGPGYEGRQNFAQIPDTDYPVCVNTINKAPDGMMAPLNIHNCTDIGEGVPFTEYFVDNLGNGGTQFIYDGFTTPLWARAAVNPCDTYHIKLIIADVGSGNYDAAVFIAAGSFSSNDTTACPLPPDTVITGIGHRATERLGLKVAPSPFQQGFTITANVQPQEVLVATLYTMQGNISMQIKGNLSQINQRFSNAGSHLATGTYLLRVSNSTALSQTIKLQKE